MGDTKGDTSAARSEPASARTALNAEPDRFQRAALRWVARFCVERREATLAEVQAAAWAFDNLADEPAALATLQRLCSR